MSFGLLINRSSWTAIAIGVLLVAIPWQARWLGPMVVDQSEFGRWSVYGTELMIIMIWLWCSVQQRHVVWPWGVGHRRVIAVCIIFMATTIGVSALPVASAATLFHVSMAILAVAVLRRGPLTAVSGLGWFVGGVVVAVGVGWVQWVTQTVSGGSWLGMSSQASWQTGVAVIEASGRWLRAYATWPHPNIFGVYAAVASLCALHLWDRLRHWWWLVAMAWCASGVCLSFSRAAMIGLVLGLIAWMIVDRMRRWSIVQGALVIVGTVAVLATIWWPVTWQRTQSQQNVLEQQSVAQRWDGYQLARTLVTQNWWQGSGPGTYVVVAQHISPTPWPQPVHNIWLLLLVEVGVGGLVIVGLLIRGVAAWARYSSEPYLWAAIGILVFVVSVLDHWLWSLYPGLLLLAVVAGFIGRSALEKQNTLA